MKRETYWMSEVLGCNLCGEPTPDAFVDGVLKGRSAWAVMCLSCHPARGVGIGPGKGQLFRRQADGRFLKTEG